MVIRRAFELVWEGEGAVPNGVSTAQLLTRAPLGVMASVGTARGRREQKRARTALAVAKHLVRCVIAVRVTETRPV